MKLLFLTTLATAMTLLGCLNVSSTTFSNKANKVYFEIVFQVPKLANSNQYDNPVRFLVKPSSALLTGNCSRYTKSTRDNSEQHMRWTGRCQYGKHPPEIIMFTYAVIGKPTPVTENIWEYTKQQANQLPPSAWRTYTIDTKPIMEEARKQYLNNALYQRNGMKVTLTLYIDNNGNITQSVEYIALPGHTWTG